MSHYHPEADSHLYDLLQEKKRATCNVALITHFLSRLGRGNLATFVSKSFIP